MEAEDHDNPPSPSTSAPKTEPPVLNISGREKSDPKAPRKRGKKKATPAPESPKVNPTTFPVILSRILLKTSDPPENSEEYTQNLCFLCLEKPASKKRVYHMFPSNNKELSRDYDYHRKLYEKHKEYKHVNNITMECPCARALYRRVQKEFTDAQWNKQGNVFESDMTKNGDVSSIYSRVHTMWIEENERLFNYIKFMSSTKI